MYQDVESFSAAGHTLVIKNSFVHQDMDMPTHLVANNKDLLELAKSRPSTNSNLLRVDGMSVVKVKRIGPQVLSG